MFYFSSIHKWFSGEPVHLIKLFHCRWQMSHIHYNSLRGEKYGLYYLLCLKVKEYCMLLYSVNSLANWYNIIREENIEYRSISTRYMLEKYWFHDILSIYREFHLFLGIYWHFIIFSSIYCDNLDGQMRINAVNLLKMP